MPLFEYKCQSCHAIVEVLALGSGQDVPPAVCPKCMKSSGFIKQFSAFATAHSDSGELPQAGCGSDHCCGGACAHGDD